MAPPIGGTTRNSQTCLIAVPPTKTAGPKLRAGLTETPVDRNENHVDEDQRQADDQAGDHAHADLGLGHAEDHGGEDERRDKLGERRGDHAELAEIARAPAVLAEPGGGDVVAAARPVAIRSRMPAPTMPPTNCEMM